MKNFSKINVLFLGILLTSNCFGMEESFENQLKDFLTGDSQYALEKYKNFTTKYEKVIIDYITNGDINFTQMIITILPHDYYAKHLVHRVAQIGNLEILKAIIEKKPEMLDISDTEGRTPLIHACDYNNVSCVKYLLEQKADPMKMFPDRKKYQHAIHPMYTIIHISGEKNPIGDVIKILGLIIKNCPQFLIHKYKGTTCLGCVDQLMDTQNWTCYPNNDKYEIQVKKEKIEYLNKIKKFIESKTRLRRFSVKEE